jgi:hypothetical protein
MIERILAPLAIGAAVTAYFLAFGCASASIPPATPEIEEPMTACEAAIILRDNPQELAQSYLVTSRELTATGFHNTGQCLLIHGTTINSIIANGCEQGYDFNELMWASISHFCADEHRLDTEGLDYEDE